MLLDAHRYPTAASLAILSIEESGKEHILRGLAIAKTNDLLKLWKDYRSHTKKNIMWLLPQLVAEGARHLDDFRNLFEDTAEHPYLLEQLKQIGFYTDCLGKAHWSEPSNIVDQDLAAMLVQIARIFIKDRDIVEKEIELWVKHMGKVKDDDLKIQKEALLHWYGEMQELGLTPEGEKFTDYIQWLGIDLNK